MWSVCMQSFYISLFFILITVQLYGEPDQAGSSRGQAEPTRYFSQAKVRRNPPPSVAIPKRPQITAFDLKRRLPHPASPDGACDSSDISESGDMPYLSPQSKQDEQAMQKEDRVFTASFKYSCWVRHEVMLDEARRRDKAYQQELDKQVVSVSQMIPAKYVTLGALLGCVFVFLR